METQNAIKLIKELKVNKFLPKYNVREACYQSYDRIRECMRFWQKFKLSLNAFRPF